MRREERAAQLADHVRELGGARVVRLPSSLTRSSITFDFGFSASLVSRAYGCSPDVALVTADLALLKWTGMLPERGCVRGVPGCFPLSRSSCARAVWPLHPLSSGKRSGGRRDKTTTTAPELWRFTSLPSFRPSPSSTSVSIFLPLVRFDWFDSIPSAPPVLLSLSAHILSPSRHPGGSINLVSSLPSHLVIVIPSLLPWLTSPSRLPHFSPDTLVQLFTTLKTSKSPTHPS